MHQYWVFLAIGSGVWIFGGIGNAALAVSPPAKLPASTSMQKTVDIKQPVNSLQFEGLDQNPELISNQEIAQSPPNILQREPDDRFLQPLPTPQPVTPEEEVPITPEEPPPAPEEPPSEEIRIPVQRIEVVGSTIFTAEDFAPIVQPLEGRAVTLEELRGVADQITQLYLEQGYITSRAVLIDQVVEDGVVEIRVIEGSLEDIEIEGNQRVNAGYIRSRIRLGADPPLNQGSLEDQLRLLQLDPLFTDIEASLRPGTGLGQSDLVVRVTEADPVFGFASVDNYSNPDVGSERTGIGLGYRSLTGLGDVLFANYYRSTTGGSNTFDFIYRIPVNPMNGTVQLRASPQDFEITNPEFAEFFDIEGNTNEYELSYRQPLIRSSREEFALSFGFTYRDGESITEFLSFNRSPPPPIEVSNQASIFQFGQDYTRRDIRGAWSFRSQFELGTTLFDATTTDETPDSQFVSWLGQIQRVQILNRDHLLIMQADVQLTPDELPSFQQFVIGGGNSLRGYRQNLLSGDNGFRLSVEDRISLLRNDAGTSILQLIPFVDLGAVWNDGDNPNILTGNTFLVGTGLGVLWEPIPRLNMRLDFGFPLVYRNDRGENAQDEGIYFNVVYQF